MKNGEYVVRKCYTSIVHTSILHPLKKKNLPHLLPPMCPTLHATLANSHYSVQFILRPTVRRPVRLGVAPPLEQMIRVYISLSNNYFLSFFM
jgi:hypothetical protein